MIYEGQSFSRKNTAKGHNLYWCKYSRSQDCPVKLKEFTDNRIITFGGLHSEGCLLKKGLQGITVTTNDHTIEMSEMVEDMVLSHLELQPKKLGDQN